MSQIETYATRDTVAVAADAVATTSTANTCDNGTRLGRCEVCAAQEARYCCPKCEVKTCCLACVKIHKQELACDGIRDRTKFIPLRRMTKQDFMSDYYFLEECTRYTEDRKSDRIKRFTRHQKEMPVHLQRMRQAAFKRRTRLLFVLQNFTRHKENTTYLNWKERRLYWRIEWVFVNAIAAAAASSSSSAASSPTISGKCNDDAPPARFVDARCNEEETLGGLLSKYMDLLQYKELAYYKSAGLGALKCLLGAERLPGRQKRYFLLDLNKSLRENLKYKTIVEYPTIYVSYEREPAGFEIIDSDEELDYDGKKTQAALVTVKREANKVSAGAEPLRKKRKATSDEAIRGNLLFDNEQELGTDDDDVDNDDDDDDSDEDVECNQEQQEMSVDVSIDEREEYFSDDGYVDDEADDEPEEYAINDRIKNDVPSSPDSVSLEG